MSRKARIIMHLIATNFYGGPEKQIVEHLKRLDGTQYRGILASYIEKGAPNEILEKAKSAGIEHHGIPMSGPLDITALWDLNGLVHRIGADVLCAHGYKAAVMGWWVGRRLGIPVIIFSRGYTTENLKVAFYEWLERRMLEKVSGVIAVSEAQRKKLESLGVHPRRSWVIRNAVMTGPGLTGDSREMKESVCERLTIPVDSKLVVTAGRLSPEKGHRVLVDAIAQMGSKAESACFVFCGNGPCQAELEKQARALGVMDKCRFPGFRRDIGEIFSVMDLFVLPSFTEGLPNVILEAFSCGKPVVATEVGGVPEIAEDGINGVLVPPDRPDLLSGAIIQCLESPEFLKKMGEAGFSKVKENFTFEVQTGKLTGIYEEVMAGHVG